MDVEIARWRLWTQGLSSPRATSSAQVVRDLLCVQAENPSQSAWAVATRTTAPDPTDLAGALAAGEVLRTHVLRPTWHYVAREDVDWLVALTAPRVAPLVERQLLVDRGLGRDELAALTAAVQEVLAATPDLTRARVVDAVREAAPSLGTRLTGPTPSLLMAHLELARLVVSGRPVEGEHTYATWADRVGGRADLLDRDEALGRLALRYLAGHGPATVKDLAYWATLTLGDARRGVAVAGDELQSFEHDGRVYWHLAGASGRGAVADPPGHLLQLLDETYRGYQDSRWVLDPDDLVPRGREAAIGMAVVDGRLVAGMRRTLRSAHVRFELAPFRTLTTSEREAVDDAAARYGRFLGLAPEVAYT